MLNLKQFDTGISPKALLEDEKGPIDLEGAEVIFFFGNHAIICEKLEEIGKVLVVFERQHTEKTGVFYGEFKVKYHNDGREERYPNNDYIQVQIMKAKGE